MDTLTLAFLIALAIVIVAAVAALAFWRHASRRVRSLARRIRDLPSRERVRLAHELAGDRSLPPLARAVMPAAVLYLGWSFDVIPDFIPFIGQVDDMVVLGLGMVLLVRRRRFELVEARLAAIEAQAGIREAGPALSSPQRPRRSPLAGVLLRSGAARMGGRLRRR